MIDRAIPLVGTIIQCRDGSSSGLKVIALPCKNKHGQTTVTVQCRCGDAFTTSLADIKSKKSTRCRTCAMKRFGGWNKKDLSAQIFTRIKVITPDGRTPASKVTYMCICSCGTVMYGVVGSSLLNGHTTSCGCLRTEKASKRLAEKQRKKRYSIGQVVGELQILEEMPPNRHRQRRYKARNTRTGRVKTYAQGDIHRQATELGRLEKRLRLLIYQALSRKGWTKGRETRELLGASMEEVKRHLGEPLPGGHLDHICPCAQARNENELIKLQHYTNLRWATAEANMYKHAKKTPEGEELCRKLLNREWIGK